MLIVDVLSILLKVFGLILIIVFIILGIKLILLTEKATKVVTDVEEEIENYKNRFSMVGRAFDYISNITEKSTLLLKKVFRKNRKKDEEY